MADGSEPWSGSDVRPSRVRGLIKKGLFPAGEEGVDWIVPEGKIDPSSPEGYVVAFLPFYDRGFATPAGKFLRTLLGYYDIEL